MLSLIETESVRESFCHQFQAALLCDTRTDVTPQLFGVPTIGVQLPLVSNETWTALAGIVLGFEAAPRITQEAPPGTPIQTDNVSANRVILYVLVIVRTWLSVGFESSWNDREEGVAVSPTIRPCANAGGSKPTKRRITSPETLYPLLTAPCDLSLCSRMFDSLKHGQSRALLS